MSACSLFFWEMCTETLLNLAATRSCDFSTNIKTEIKEKTKKGNMSILLLNMSCPKTWPKLCIAQVLPKPVCEVCNLTTKYILFLFFSPIIFNHKPCQVLSFAYQHVYLAACLLFFLPFCSATLLFGQHFHLAVKSNLLNLLFYF